MLKKKRIIFIYILIILSIFILFQYLNTGNIKSISHYKKRFEIIAHRGVHHDFHRKNLKWNSCTAKRIYKPTHNYIENTINSIKKAFEYGATVVEIDIRVTKDNKLVVFHDFMLDCRTDGKGYVKEHNLEYLRKLDLGYGYTYNNGKTYPFRGKAIGEIKTLKEVLDFFPNNSFLIDHKDNNIFTAKLIVNILSNYSKIRQKKIYIWTGDEAYREIKKTISIRRLFKPKASMKSFYKKYILSLGLLGINDNIKNEGLAIDLKHTKYIWGWPYKFLEKLYKNNTRFYFYLNSKNEIKYIKNLKIDGIITDHIELIAPVFLN